MPAGIRAKIRKWYDGEIKPHENPPGSNLQVIAWWLERHWTSELAHKLVDFWLADWKWIIGTVLALAGLWLAYLKLG
jgi:hypothetical protein